MLRPLQGRSILRAVPIIFMGIAILISIGRGSEKPASGKAHLCKVLLELYGDKARGVGSHVFELPLSPAQPLYFSRLERKNRLRPASLLILQLHAGE